MPKCIKVKRMCSSEGGGPEEKYSYEHDVRVSNSIWRVSFRPGSNCIGKHRNEDMNMAIRAYIDNMKISGSGGRYLRRCNIHSGRCCNKTEGGGGSRGSYGRWRSGHGSPPLSLRFNQRKFLDSSVFWYKVTIPHGGRYSKDYILNMLLAKIAPTVFTPLGYEVRGTDSSFFVDDSQAAEKLASINKKITTIKGYKMLIKVRPGLPHVELDYTMKEKIKAAMVKRYNANLKALDLSRFHTDPDLVDNYAVALFRPSVMSVVLDIVVENIPELRALDLSDNKLCSLDSLSVLSLKVPNVRVLHIGRNRVRDMYQLDYLEGLCLVELVLVGNPLYDRYVDKSVYISEVRKRFPKVLKLDGVDLIPPILFDVNEDIQMPTNKGNYFCAEEGMAVARQFLQQYYHLYDSDNREQLVNAYHDNAIFSITSTHLQGQSSANTSKLVNYLTGSRNILRMKDSTTRQKLLYQGKMAIIACLCKLPRTQHDPLSFVVDVTVFTPHLIMMSVSGIFREPGPTGNQPLRSFNRAFVIVPFGKGLCIVNEQLFVTSATGEQTKMAFRTLSPALLPPPTPVPFAASPSPALTDDNMKMQMVESFAAQSGMNVDFAKKCLDASNWNFQQATHTFTVLNKRGEIPAEAFIK